jgi:hypothetical protein
MRAAYHEERGLAHEVIRLGEVPDRVVVEIDD